MENDERIPTEATDSYWIFALNETYKYIKKREDRNSGKWLIFEHQSEIDQTWQKIKEATILGFLGPSSKVSTAKLNPNASEVEYKVICVFTEDFNDNNSPCNFSKIKNSV